ncbi:serine hydrolase domain-containing protein [Streptomyces pactum]|uniref:serine hydrolase domain-containing protein n=1 Tax=Streptomyces pactum TaxID=68249 RepID=UPI0036FCB406
MPLVRGRRAARTATLVVCALSAALLPARAHATGPDGATPVPPAPPAAAAHPGALRLERDAAALHRAGYTGVSVRLDTPRGAHTARGGVADLRTGRPVPWQGYLRTGSTTKTFVATVLLQLTGEGRVSLDDTVERWLPGVVHGHGNDGRRITLRQLLQHTSGLPDYDGDVVPEFSARGYLAHRWTTYSPAERVALALSHPPSFAPGTGWEYSNTNYILAGMVIEAVTGRGWEREVHDRVLRPLGLRHTLIPGDHPFLPHPHARDYQQFGPGEPFTDTTVAYLPLDGGADGSIISTAADLNRFFSALLRGRLLGPAQLAEMRRTVALPEGSGGVPGTRYGLGLEWTPLSCGGGYWGHSGGGFGFYVWPGATEDGRTALTLSVHSQAGDPVVAGRQARAATAVVDRALCDARR